MKFVRVLLLAFVLVMTLNAVGVSAQSFATVSPDMLDLTLDQGETVTEQVSITVHPHCVRPIDVDVVGSIRSALVNNLTGVVTNSCGGDTSTFDVEITGIGAPQQYDLQFVDAEFGGVIASIPVTITPGPTPTVEHIMGLRIRNQGIEFQVESSGCTTKSDFEVHAVGSSPLQLRLMRLQEDPCDAFVPYGTMIRYRYHELGIAPGEEYLVVNPLAVVQRPPRR